MEERKREEEMRAGRKGDGREGDATEAEWRAGGEVGGLSRTFFESLQQE